MLAVVVIGMISIYSIALGSDEGLLPPQLGLIYWIGHDGFPVAGSGTGGWRIRIGGEPL
jgi:hypothetical protein